MQDARIETRESSNIDSIANGESINNYRHSNHCGRKGNRIMRKKISVKDFKAIHFQYGMSMEGVLYPSKNSKVVYMINQSQLTLFFDFKLTHSEEFTKQKILLDWSSPHYGRTNVNFICPICGRRVTTLHNSVAAYVCRECDKSANKGHPDDWQEHSHLLALL